MAYEPRLTAALSGVTMAQLAYWRRPRGNTSALFLPEISSGNRVLYSFRDVVALRTVAFLREDSSLQKIRRALGTLKSIGESDHLSAYRLVATGETIALVGEDETVDLVARPGQQIIAEMVNVLGPFSNRRGDAVPDFAHPRRNLEVDAGTLSGFPVIRGTRVPYDLVAELVEDGVSPEQVGTYYPAVSANAARDAHDYAKYVLRAAA